MRIQTVANARLRFSRRFHVPPGQTTRASDALPARRKQNSARQFIVAWTTILGGLGSFVATSNDAPAPSQRPAAARSDARPDVRKDNSWTNDMVWIRGGAFWMGSTSANPDEQPLHQVTVDGFWMDKTEVTNEQFEKFARATGYVTIAERKPNAKDFPGVPEESLVPGSIVFSPPSLDDLNRERTPAGYEPLKDYPMENHFIWWRYVAGANWRHPEGPDSDIRGREQHPIVHIAWDDAVACCKWAGKRLPTEAEWEFAARGGLDRKRYVWGDELTPGGKWLANIWQGSFPLKNTLEDGFRGTAPVASFPPNAYGIYDMAGNVWEWCADWYLPDYYAHTPVKNPPART